MAAEKGFAAKEKVVVGWAEKKPGNSGETPRNRVFEINPVSSDATRGYNLDNFLKK